MASGLDQNPPIINLVKSQPDVERQYINNALRALSRAIGSGSNIPSPSGHAGEYLSTDGVTIFWAAISGSGTVTSVAASGGTTGLSFSGSPITTSGTLTLAGTLAITNGGTGATTASAALTNLLPPQAGNSGKALTTNGTTASWQDPVPTNLKLSCLTFGWDGAGVDLIAGQLLRGRASYPMTITDVTVLADISGDCVVDIWKDTFTNYPPTAPDSITGTAPPTLTASNKSYNTTLTGWTTTVNTGDTFICRITSISGGITQLNVTLGGTRV